jgi:phosphoinositide-3-kinase, regulatory subunit 4
VLLDVDSHDRFLKSVCCKHDEVLLIIKVYFKRTGEPINLKIIASSGSQAPYPLMSSF